MSLHTRLHFNKGERIVWRRRMTLWSLWPFWLLGLATIWLYGIGLLFWLYAVVKWIRIRYLVTSQRVIKAIDHYAFLLHVETKEMPLTNINGIDVSQNMIGRLLGYTTGDEMKPVRSSWRWEQAP